MKNLKIGDVLVAKRNLIKSLTIGKSYPIKSINEIEVVIIDDTNCSNYFTLDNLDKYFTIKPNPMPKKEESPKYEGKIEPLQDNKDVYMVVVLGMMCYVQYDTYDKAFEECLRLSKKENKTAYVLKAVTKVEQIPNVTQYE